MSEFRKRLIDPIMPPLLAVMFIALMVFSVSRILLAIPEKGSTTLALIISAEVLGLASVLSAGRKLRAAQRILLVLLGLGLIGGGAASASLGIRKIEDLGGFPVTLQAKNIRFVEKSLKAPADTLVAISFTNDDPVPHNVVVTSDTAGFKPVFDPKTTVTGPGHTTYKVPALKEGEYYYHCAVHPTMKGELLVGNVSAQPEPTPSNTPMAHESMPPSAGPQTQPDLMANGFTFDQKTLLLKALAPITIHFDNRDSAPHNFAIYNKLGGTRIVKLPDFTGPGHTEWKFTAPAAGMYYFQCDIHPNMNGTVEFR